MGTKNNPGQFDCYANAEPDEPMFILLGRDKHAPLLVKLWADLRQMDGEDIAKVTEAIQCATEMGKFRAARIASKAAHTSQPDTK
jgi:hypothetical protein